MGYIMNIDNNDNATFVRDDKKNKKYDKKKFKRLQKMKKNSKKINRKDK